MKNTRKFLTLLLTLAVFVTCFSLVAYADEEVMTPDEAAAAYAEAVALDSKLLEFYEADTYFELRVENSELTLTQTEEGKLLKGGVYSETVMSDALHISSFNPTKVNLAQNAPASFGVNFRVKLSENSPITLYAVSSETGDYLSLFSISEGKVTHKFDTEKISYVYEEIPEIVAGEFIDVAIYVEKADGTDNVTISVSKAGTQLLNTSYSYANGTTDFLKGSFKLDSAYLSTSDASFGYIEVYSGTFGRYLDNSLNTEAIAAGVVKAYEDYTAFKSLPGIENGAFELAEMIAKVAVVYDFNSTDSSVTAAFEDCVAVVSAAYEALVNDADTAINAEDFAQKAYNDKLDTVNVILSFEEYMTKLSESEFSDISAVDFAKIEKAVADAYDELAVLKEIEEDAIYVINELSKISNIYLATYEELKTAYASVLSVTICETYYSDLYPADVVNEAVQKRNKVMLDYPLLNAQALAFVENMEIATDNTAEFSERYASYVIAKENKFTDSTYDTYLEDTTIAELLEKYDVLDAEMLAVSDYAEQFLSKIREAALTPSYTVKVKALDAAKPYLEDVEVGYPEVADAIASYYAMREDIASRKELAKRYIQAVLNVQLASTVKDKTAAIEIAESLAVLGQELSVTVDGMPITVNEANIILSNEKSAISLKATRISNYVSAASNIAKAGSLLERRQAINAALALKAGLTEDLEEEDVISATAVIDAAITAYNNDVNGANDVAEEKETAALTLLTKTVPSKKIADVVAIIKKFYE